MKTYDLPVLMSDSENIMFIADCALDQCINKC